MVIASEVRKAQSSLSEVLETLNSSCKIHQTKEHWP